MPSNTGSLATGQSIVQNNDIGIGNNINSQTPNIDISALTPSSVPPDLVLNGSDLTDGSKVYRFPEDTPNYYMQLPISRYMRADWRSVGITQEEARIIFPLPQTMIDNHNVRYDISDIGISGAVGLDMINGQFSEAAAKAAIGTVEGGLKIGANALGDLLGSGASKAAQNTAKGLLAAAGIATNDFMTVMLKGPDYKRRDFIWRFSPKNSKETYSLQAIIKLINNAMAPSLIGGTSSTFFRWPRVWRPKFVYGTDPDLLGAMTFFMRPSVVTDFSVNYTPNNVYSPFAKTKGPSSVDIHMTFLELEYWLSGDFTDHQPAGATLSDAQKGALGWLDSHTPSTTPGNDVKTNGITIRPITGGG